MRVTSANMAAALRIQSDWSRALRWERSLYPFLCSCPCPRPCSAHGRLFSLQQGRGRGLAELPQPR